MRIFNSPLLFPVNRIRSGIAFIMAVLITAGLGLPSTQFVAAQKRQVSSKKLTEEQQIVHVLNRLGFGARPGDIERVKSIGIDNYINQQLAPEQIPDTAAESKVKDLTSLTMTNWEGLPKYSDQSL